MTSATRDLPQGGEPDVQMPCDWCTREQVSFAHPAAHITLWPEGLQGLGSGGMRNWRICTTCLDTLAKLITWRKNGDRLPTQP